MGKRPIRCRLLLEKSDTGHLVTLLRGQETISVQPEDCLGLLNNPIFDGANASFDVTQKQYKTIRRRASARQSKIPAQCYVPHLYVSNERVDA
jgi:hypothetical protein